MSSEVLPASSADAQDEVHVVSEEHAVILTAAQRGRSATGAFTAQATLAAARARFRPECAALRDLLAS